MVELKNGETYSGLLEASDSWMNLNLQNVTCFAKDGSKSWTIPFCYLRGSHIKYLSVPKDVLDAVQEASGLSTLSTPGGFVRNSSDSHGHYNRGDRGGDRSRGGDNRYRSGGGGSRGGGGGGGGGDSGGGGGYRNAG